LNFCYFHDRPVSRLNRLKEARTWFLTYGAMPIVFPLKNSSIRTHNFFEVATVFYLYWIQVAVSLLKPVVTLL
jgi:hypothetical protein